MDNKDNDIANKAQFESMHRGLLFVIIKDNNNSDVGIDMPIIFGYFYALAMNFTIQKQYKYC